MQCEETLDLLAETAQRNSKGADRSENPSVVYAPGGVSAGGTKDGAVCANVRMISGAEAPTLKAIMGVSSIAELSYTNAKNPPSRGSTIKGSQYRGSLRS